MDLPEIDEFTAGIYQIEAIDDVIGGADGISNRQAKALANRTKHIRDHALMDDTNPIGNYAIGDLFYATGARLLGKRNIGASGRVLVSDGAAPQWSLTTGISSLGTQVADLLFVDALYDIGKAGATRPRDLFLSRNLAVGGSITGSVNNEFSDANDSLIAPIAIRNLSSGAAAGMRLLLGNNVSGGASTVAVFSSNHATKPNYLEILNQFAAPLLLGTDGTTRITIGGAGQLGFFGSAGVAKQTGVAITAAGIHAALVAYGLIS